MKFLTRIKTIIVYAMFLALNPAVITNAYAATDTDSDGVINSSDNCILASNPLQRDTDNDGYGNFCDPDFDNNLFVGLPDFDYFKSKYGTADPDADLNGDGVVNLADFAIMRPLFSKPPGPSYIDLPGQASLYLPAAIGNTLQFFVTISEPGQPVQTEYSYTDISKTKIFNSYDVYNVRNDLLTPADENENLYFSEQNDGVNFHGWFDENSDGQGFSLKITNETPVLYLKSAFIVGDTWSTTTNMAVEIDGFVVSIIPSIWRYAVLAIEDVTVPAGTFQNCYKIQQVIISGNPVTVEKETIWLAKDIGIVKKESGGGVYVDELQYASVNGTEYGLEVIHQLDNASLNGAYLHNSQSIELTSATTEVWSTTGSITFDGAGNCSYTGAIEKGIRRTDDVLPYTLETITGTPDNGACTYSLAGDGTLTIDGKTSYAVNPDAGTIVGINVIPGADTVISAVETMVKQSGGLTDASLSGTFLQNAQSTDLVTPASTQVWSWASGITFDGAGNCSYIGTLEKGIIRTDDVMPRTVELFTGTPDNGICTYSLSGDGTLTIDGDPSYVYNPDQGTITGINFFSGFDQVTAIETMVEQSSELDNASIAGTYLLAGRSTELTPTKTEAWSWTGNITFDGAGNCNYVGTLEKGIWRNDDVTPRTLESFTGTPDNASCTYSLASDGTLTIDGSTSYAVNQDTSTIVGINFFSGADFVASVVERMVKSSD